jgi:hypothetical protein
MTSPRTNDLVRDATELLATHGFTPIVTNGGKHLKIRWFDHGRRYTLIVPATPSDKRARLNSRAVLRRILRNGGGHHDDR